MAEPRPAGAGTTKRFYERATAERAESGFAILLDGRPTRSPGRAPLVLPTVPLAEAVAEEWNRQGPAIDPSSMPLTRLANTAIDGVSSEIEAVQADLVRYAGSDLVMYRAGEPDRLVAAQATAWDPVLGWARSALSARFLLSEGVMFVTQPEAALGRVRKAIEAERSPFRLAALHVMTTLTGSVLIALMHGAGALDLEAAWRSAHVDELHQEAMWGQDLEAVQRRDARERDFAAASRVFALAVEAPRN